MRNSDLSSFLSNRKPGQEPDTHQLLAFSARPKPTAPSLAKKITHSSPDHTATSLHKRKKIAHKLAPSDSSRNSSVLPSHSASAIASRAASPSIDVTGRPEIFKQAIENAGELEDSKRSSLAQDSSYGSYEDMITNALIRLEGDFATSNGETEKYPGSKPKIIFNWMEQNVPGLPENFRASATQALKKGCARGKFKKEGASLYKHNPDFKNSINSSGRRGRKVVLNVSMSASKSANELRLLSSSSASGIIPEPSGQQARHSSDPNHLQSSGFSEQQDRSSVTSSIESVVGDSEALNISSNNTHNSASNPITSTTATATTATTILSSIHMPPMSSIFNAAGAGVTNSNPVATSAAAPPFTSSTGFTPTHFSLASSAPPLLNTAATTKIGNSVSSGNGSNSIPMMATTNNTSYSSTATAAAAPGNNNTGTVLSGRKFFSRIPTNLSNTYLNSSATTTAVLSGPSSSLFSPSAPPTLPPPAQSQPSYSVVSHFSAASNHDTISSAIPFQFMDSTRGNIQPPTTTSMYLQNTISVAPPHPPHHYNQQQQHHHYQYHQQHPHQQQQHHHPRHHHQQQHLQHLPFPKVHQHSTYLQTPFPSNDRKGSVSSATTTSSNSIEDDEKDVFSYDLL